jgi:clan AA aspartic protease
VDWGACHDSDRGLEESDRQMISGTVNARREAVITIEVEGPSGRRHSVDAVIDTGFNRFLTLPAALIASLGLRRLSWDRVELGDGSKRLVSVHRAFVNWHGNRRNVIVHVAEESFVGMSLLADHEVRIQVVPDGEVTIEAMT